MGTVQCRCAIVLFLFSIRLASSRPKSSLHEVVPGVLHVHGAAAGAGVRNAAVRDAAVRAGRAAARKRQKGGPRVRRRDGGTFARIGH